MDGRNSKYSELKFKYSERKFKYSERNKNYFRSIVLKNISLNTVLC